MGAKLMTEMTCDNCGSSGLFAATDRKTGWIRGSVSVHNEDATVRDTRHWVACKEACISGAVVAWLNAPATPTMLTAAQQ